MHTEDYSKEVLDGGSTTQIGEKHGLVCSGKPPSGEPPKEGIVFLIKFPQNQSRGVFPDTPLKALSWLLFQGCLAPTFGDSLGDHQRRPFFWGQDVEVNWGSRGELGALAAGLSEDSFEDVGPSIEGSDGSVGDRVSS